MLHNFIQDKVYYRIFAKDFKQSTHLYAKHRLIDATKIIEVQHNRDLVQKELEATNLLVLKQVHGTNVIDADPITDFSIEPEADGAVTSKANIALSIQTADCIPLLLSADDGKIIGAAHCGWRGSKDGVIEKIVTTMLNKGAANIQAFIGPAIQQFSYEVDQRFYNDFLYNKANKLFFTLSRPGHYMFDLPRFVESQLHKCGIKEIININHDTYTRPDLYYSYRKMSHDNAIGYERILSTIIIKDS